jgi:hypothetical protein
MDLPVFWRSARLCSSRAIVCLPVQAVVITAVRRRDHLVIRGTAGLTDFLRIAYLVKLGDCQPTTSSFESFDVLVTASTGRESTRRTRFWSCGSGVSGAIRGTARARGIAAHCPRVVVKYRPNPKKLVLTPMPSPSGLKRKIQILFYCQRSRSPFTSLSKQISPVFSLF